MSALTPPGIQLAPLAAPGARTGTRGWLPGLWAMLKFDAAMARAWGPTMAAVQVIIGVGMALVYGFFYPRITPGVALYIATGTPTLALIPLGLVVVPKAVCQHKLTGVFDFIWSLPVPRSAQCASTFVLYTVLALPGMVLALLVASVRYDIHLSVSPEVIPAALLSALMTTSVGFGMALAIPRPMITNVITDVLNFVVLLFSPIVFPLGQLPGWLADVHQVLPFYNMAVVIRAGLTSGVVTGVTTSFLVLAAWTLAGCAATAWVIARRH